MGASLAGYVALIGRPNTGKSTLLNAILGEKLSIVSPHAQTTWQAVIGIHTGARSQMIFVDTPGLLEPRDLLHRSMLEAARATVDSADVVLVLVDATRPRHEMDAADRLRDVLQRRKGPILVAVNKIDCASEAAIAALAQWAGETLGARVHRISARARNGIEELVREIEAALPPMPFLYPNDQIAAQPVRFFVAELIRETLLEQFRQEIPYSTWCVIDAYDESRSPISIRAILYAEQNSQKGILIGEGGRAIKELGIAAREKIERFIGERVFLELRVKVAQGWRQKARQLHRFGFRVPTAG
ncbi:MAG: GTPase Era [Gemmatimonadetes bacterium]|nr:GTPase Era [Gemmatimonadota bacterium]